MTAEEGPEGFLARWSRRKRQAAAPAREGPPPSAPALEDAPLTAPAWEGRPLAAPARENAPLAAPDAPAPDADAAAGRRPAGGDPAFDPATLPPIEDLTAESDLLPFLQPRVPPALRQAAMRRMWSLDPLIRDFVGPADYAWDFNAPNGVPGFALDLGGDAAKLLAQAIGQVPSPEPADPSAPRGEADDPGDPPARPGIPGIAPAPDALDRPGTPRRDAVAEGASPWREEGAEGVALLRDEVAEGPPMARDERAEAPPPRRHGGALPR